jgi:actin-related protein 8
MEKVQIIPPPKDVDKRVLTWKGASVLGRMEGVTDMWVTGADWVRGEHEFFLPCPSRSLENTFGMRAVKERCFLL